MEFSDGTLNPDRLLSETAHVQLPQQHYCFAMQFLPCSVQKKKNKKGQ